MTPTLLVGLAAGAASSLLYVGAGVGSLMAFVAPLPLLIAGLGWRSPTAAAGAVLGTVAAAAIAGPWGGIGYLLAVAGPAVWLSAFALLARPADPGSPAGGLVFWAALLSAALVLATLLLSFDYAGFELHLTDIFARALREHGVAEADAGPIALWLARVAPAVSAAAWMLVLLLNVWAAGRIVRISGREQRPWPDLAAISLPAVAAPLFGLAAAMLFGPGLIRAAGSVLTAVLTMAFMLMGLAVLHAVTRGQAGRGFILGALYVSLVVLPWTGLALALLGLIEPALKLRRRRQARLASHHRFPTKP